MFARSMLAVTLLLASAVAVSAGRIASNQERHLLIHHTAHDVAKAMCPYPMTQQYGCPINASARQTATMHSTRRLRDRLMKESPREYHHLASLGGKSLHSYWDYSNSNDDTTTAHTTTQGGNSTSTTTNPYSFFDPGAVPVGIGFDVTTMSTRLPYFYPLAREGTPVFKSTIEHEFYDNIADYAVSRQPNATKIGKATVGSFNADMNDVHASYFGHRSSYHRTIQKDIVNHLELDMSSLFPLPYVQWMADEVLPLSILENDDKEVYKAFIANWGTHIVTKAAVGGICEEELSVSTCYAHGNLDSLNNLASLHLASTTKQITKTSMSHDWQEHVSSHTVQMWGGNPTLMDMSQWKEREKTLLAAPVLVEVEELVPLWNFFNSSATVQANMKAVIEEYIADENSRRQVQLENIAKARSYAVTVTGQTQYNDQCWQLVTNGCYQYYRHYESFRGTGFIGNVGHTHVGTCSNVGGWTGTMPVQDSTTMTLSPTSNAQQSASLSNSYVYSNCETLNGPWWSCLGSNYPAIATSAGLEVTCSVNDKGEVSATDVTPAHFLQYKVGKAPNSTVPGKPTKNGCSKVTKTYSGGVFDVSGYGFYLMSGSVTFEGWCCVNTGTIMIDIQQMCHGAMYQNPADACPSLQQALNAPGYQT